MGRRALQPAIFGIAALSFLLPFANVSCAGEAPDESTLAEAPDELAEGADLAGYEMVIGADPGEDFEKALEAFAIEEGTVNVGAEPFAAVALGAALAGLTLSLLAPPARRARHALVCAVVGTAALGVLGLAPVLASLGLFRVSWKPGYWVCLVLFLGATWVAYEESRFSESPGDGAGSRLPPRPGPSRAPPAPPR